MQVDMMEYIGKYYCMFVNKNYTILKNFYEDNKEYYLQHNVTFPVYCFVEFLRKKDKILDQDDNIKANIFRTPLEELLMVYDIK